MKDRNRIPRIVEPDAVNGDGEPIDVIANLRSKKELAATIVPGMIMILEDLEEQMLLKGEKDDGTIEDMKDKMREIASAYGVDPEPDND